MYLQSIYRCSFQPSFQPLKDDTSGADHDCTLSGLTEKTRQDENVTISDGFIDR